MPVNKNRMSRLLGVDATDGNAARVGLEGTPMVPIKVAKLAITDLTTGENDTGFDLPTAGVVFDVFVQVTTAEATATTKTIDVGLLASETGGDADGFLDGVVTSAAGVVGPEVSATDGTNQNYFAAAPKLGALLRQGSLGTDAAGEAAALIKKAHILNGTAKSVTFTLGSAHTELAGNIYIVYCDFAQV